MFHAGFLFTGTRVFGSPDQIDLWATDTQVRLKLSFSEEAVLLDEEESRQVRRWAELAAQTAVLAAEEDLLAHRQMLVHSTKSCRDLNRAAEKRQARAAKKAKAPQNGAAADNLVDIGEWKARNTPIAVGCDKPAA